MEFLTLSTGHVYESQRRDVDDQIIKFLKPMASTGRYPIPKMPLDVEVTIVPEPLGYAIFTPMLKDGTPVTHCGVAWAKAGAAELWTELEEIYLTMIANIPALQRANLNAEARQPAFLPWLAVILCPGIAVLGPDAAMLSDFEKCLAWTILEKFNPK